MKRIIITLICLSLLTNCMVSKQCTNKYGTKSGKIHKNLYK